MFGNVFRAHQVLYDIRNVATPVVASVVQYDDSWTFLQNGATKLPPCSLLIFAAEQYEIRPVVTVVDINIPCVNIRGRCYIPKEPTSSDMGKTRTQRSFGLFQNAYTRQITIMSPRFDCEEV